MNNSRNTLQVFEHHTLRWRKNSLFEERHFKALVAYGYKTNEQYYSVGHERIKFNQYVGVIQVDDLTIEILPKTDIYDTTEASKRVWHNALIGMLQECRLIRLESITNAKLKLKSASVLDLYYDAFLTETELIVRQGLRKRYRIISENLTKVTGKINFSVHCRRNYLHKERFFVEHQIYNIDNTFNRILLKALRVLGQIVSSPKFESRIKKLLMHLEAVSDVRIMADCFESLKYDRNSERYRQAITLAKLIILRYCPDLKGGRENVLAILFDMNRLYEHYIYRKLKVLEYSPDIPVVRVSEQVFRPFWETSNLRADVVVECNSGNKYVIDTKWKVPSNRRPADSDLKQMFVYDLHYDSCLSILLYPKTVHETLDKKPFKKEPFQDRNCQIAFVDIFAEDGSLNRDLGHRLYYELLESEIRGNTV